MTSIRGVVQPQGKGKGHVAQWEQSGKGRPFFNERCSKACAALQPGTLNIVLPGCRSAEDVEAMIALHLGPHDFATSDPTPGRVLRFWVVDLEGEFGSTSRLRKGKTFVVRLNTSRAPYLELKSECHFRREAGVKDEDSVTVVRKGAAPSSGRGTA